MQPLGDAMQHLRLLARMGKAIGTDLTDVFAAGEISAEDWAKMITDCRGCESPDGCRRWLETVEKSEEAGHASQPPVHCCNAARLLQLRDGVNQLGA